MNCKINEDYKSKLNLYDTQMAIAFIKKVFEENLSNALNLKRVSAPLFVLKNSGLNDNLNGTERPVSFKRLNDNNELEIVHSLAKWKRLALGKYGFDVDCGLYTDMNAIRRDESLDNIHSIYVDQWDWEKVIDRQSRNIDYLKLQVIKIVESIYNTNIELKKKFDALSLDFKNEVYFITTDELEALYPDVSPKEREYKCVKEHGNTFLMKIGCKLASGMPHDGRAPDYDDWQLNGDLLVYNEILDDVFELSSMGIRVDEVSLYSQLKESNNLDRINLPFHKMILNKELPLTIGGGIGQSRLSMLLLQKMHIGEVQVSVWDEETYKICNDKKVKLL